MCNSPGVQFECTNSVFRPEPYLSRFQSNSRAYANTHLSGSYRSENPYPFTFFASDNKVWSFSTRRSQVPSLTRYSFNRASAFCPPVMVNPRVMYAADAEGLMTNVQNTHAINRSHINISFGTPYASG